jgi:hypothetical protein
MFQPSFAPGHQLIIDGLCPAQDDGLPSCSSYLFKENLESFHVKQT